MQYETFLNHVPLWGIFLIIISLVFLGIECGYRLGRHRALEKDPEKETSVGTMVAAIMGLLAFLLAFTFGAAASRFETRRLNLLDEVNAIGTTYLRAKMLPEPDRGEIRKMLREYVQVRLHGVQSGDVETAIKRSEVLQEQVWNRAAVLGEKNQNSIVIGLFIQSLNEMIDIHTIRIKMGLYSSIPGIIWLGLYGITVLAMGELGYQIGLAGKKRPLAIPGIAFSFAVVMVMIADLDRPGEGMILVNQKAMMDLEESMEATKP